MIQLAMCCLQGTVRQTLQNVTSSKTTTRELQILDLSMMSMKLYKWEELEKEVVAKRYSQWWIQGGGYGGCSPPPLCQVIFSLCSYISNDDRLVTG